jgi:regulator of RNase E activity RraA
MAVSSGDLIHADQHGAVIVPLGRFKEMREALADLTAREAKIIAAAKKKGATLEEIKAAIRG